MSNTLTGLYPVIYRAIDVVSRELVGFIPAVSRDARATRAGLNQTVRSPVVPALAAGNITPAATSSSGTDRIISYVDLTLSKSRKVPFHITGEEEVALGESATPIMQQSFEQAFRTLANEIEADLAALYVASSRAYGSAGTAPFGTAGDFSDFAQMHVILDDNGAPRTGRQLVIGSAAMGNIRGKQSVLFKANEAGTDELLRNGIVARVEGFDIHDSAQVKAHTKGAGTGYDVNNGAGYAVKDTTITLDGGTVNTTGIKAGDVVTWAGDSNKYVVNTGLTDVAGDIVLNKPGLRATLADTVEMTIGNSYAANMAFTRDAIVLATRPPARPAGGDAADDTMMVTDPISGITFEVAVYRQYHQVTYEVGLVWGVVANKSEHMAILLG